MEDEEDLERITKEYFDHQYKEMLTTVEDNLEALHNNYIALLDFRRKYRQDYKTHRIIHYLTEKGITYKPGTKRSIGFKNYNDTKKK